VETDQLLIIRHSRTVRAWCSACRGEVDLVDMAEGETLMGMVGSELRRYGDAHGWHFCRTQGGVEFICARSLNGSA